MYQTGVSDLFGTNWNASFPSWYVYLTFEWLCLKCLLISWESDKEFEFRNLSRYIYNKLTWRLVAYKFKHWSLGNKLRSKAMRRNNLHKPSWKRISRKGVMYFKFEYWFFF